MEVENFEEFVSLAKVLIILSLFIGKLKTLASSLYNRTINLQQRTEYDIVVKVLYIISLAELNCYNNENSIEALRYVEILFDVCNRRVCV